MANYRATITSNALAISKNSKTPSVKLQLKTSLRLDDNIPVATTFYADLWLTEKTKVKTIETLRAIGYQGNDIGELNNPCLAGIEVEISTHFEDYNGNSYEKVDFVNEIGSFENRGIKSLDDAAAKRLAMNINSILRNTKVTSNSSQCQAKQQPVTQESEDDLPF